MVPFVTKTRTRLLQTVCGHKVAFVENQPQNRIITWLSWTGVVHGGHCLVRVLRVKLTSELPAAREGFLI